MHDNHTAHPLAQWLRRHSIIWSQCGPTAVVNGHVGREALNLMSSLNYEQDTTIILDAGDNRILVVAIGY